MAPKLHSQYEWHQPNANDLKPTGNDDAEIHQGAQQGAHNQQQPTLYAPWEFPSHHAT